MTEMSEVNNNTQEENEQVRTTVVNLHRNEYEQYIGRKGKGEDGYYGNPFDMRNFNREECLERYAEWFYHRIKTDYNFKVKILKLHGKVLGCFCKPNDCHGDIIAEYVNACFEKQEQTSVASKSSGSFDSGLRAKACAVRNANLPKSIEVPDVQMIEGVACGAKEFEVWFEDNKAFITTRLMALEHGATEITTEQRSPQQKDHEMYENKIKAMLEA